MGFSSLLTCSLHLALILLSALMSPAANAANWVQVARGDAATYFLDTTSVTRDGSYVLASIRAVFGDMQISGSGVGYVVAVSKRRFACSRKEATVVEVSYYDVKDRLLDNENKPSDTWNTPKKGSIAEAILQNVCNVQPSVRAAPSGSPGAAKDELTLISKDDKAEWNLVNESVSFAGKRFSAVVFQELINNVPDQVSNKEIKTLGVRVGGDCASSHFWVTLKRAFDDKMELIREVDLSDSDSRPTQYADNTIAFIILKSVCNAKGFQVAAATPSNSNSANTAGGGTSAPSPEQRGERTTGSAFAVTSNGYLLTNNHVVKDCNKLTASAPGVSPTVARVMARDDRNDLALVQSQLPTPTYATFRSTPMRSGENVVALGFPLKGVLANEVNVSTGTVGALAGIANDTSKLQLSAPIQPGNSGGPLLDSTASVSAIVVEKLDALAVAKATGSIPEGIAFGVKGELILLFLRSAGIEPRMAASGLPKLDAAEIAQRGRPMTFVLECERRG